MRKLASILTVLLVAGSGPAGAEENVKLAQTGMQFLSVMSDARAAALAGAVTTMRLRSASLFFNPACMAETDRLLDFAASYNKWIADIKHSTASVAYRPASGDLGVFGLSVQFVDYGEILGTSVAANNIGYVDNGTINAYGLAAGIGYAKALSEAFSVGGDVRWVMQNLGESLVPTGQGPQLKKNQASVLAFDFGTLFKPGFKSFAFGMSVRNFAKEVAFEEQAFELPLTFTIGVSMDLMDFLEDRSIIQAAYLSVDAVHNRDYYEQVFVGGEVSLIDALDLRGGYIVNSDEQGFTTGFGLHQFGIAVDYAYTPFGVFNDAHRVTLRVGL
ncbi:MAG: PorV/PorQ family protein [Bacteroidota bacterium]